MGVHGGTVHPSADMGCLKSSRSLCLCNLPHDLGNSLWCSWSENAVLEPRLKKFIREEQESVSGGGGK